MPRRFSSWLGGAQYHSEQTRSSIAELSPVDYRPDPISSLPAEIFYAVLDEVGERHQRSRVLRSLSCANKTLHQYVQPRLWQTFNITDSPNRSFYPGLSASDSRRRCLADSCNAIARALSRATCVWELTVTVNSSSLQGFESSSAINRIMHALLALPSLRVLTVHILSPTRQAARALASMMRKAHFSFDLKAFTCPVFMEPEIFPFLAQQHSIEQYAVTLDNSSPSQKHAATIARSFRAVSTSVLPNLLRYSGHTIYTQSLMWDRTFHHISLFVHWRFFVPDAQTASRMETLVADKSHLAHISALNIEVDNFLPVRQNAELGKLVAGVYGISPRFIERLRVTESTGLYKFPVFPPVERESLSFFTQLRYLEVAWQNSGWYKWMRFRRRDLFLSESGRFIQLASGACPNLQSVVVSIEKGFLKFERVAVDSPPVLSADEDDEGHSISLVGSDSTWSVRFSTEPPSWTGGPYSFPALRRADG